MHNYYLLINKLGLVLSLHLLSQLYLYSNLLYLYNFPHLLLLPKLPVSSNYCYYRCFTYFNFFNLFTIFNINNTNCILIHISYIGVLAVSRYPKTMGTLPYSYIVYKFISFGIKIAILYWQRKEESKIY